MGSDRFTRVVFALAVVLLLALSQSRYMGNNDGSRLATVESLVDRGTYAIDGSRYATIDNRQYKGRLYSSKPPTLPTAMAGVYWVLKQLGLTLDSAERLVIKVMTLLCIGLPYLGFLWGWSRLLRKLTQDERVYRFSLLAGAFGNYAAAFSTAINNHSVAAVATFFALYHALHLLTLREGATPARDRRSLAWAGFASAWAVILDFPAAVGLGLLGLWLLWRGPDRRAFWTHFVAAACLPLGLHVALNMVVTGGNPLPMYKIGDYKFPGSYWNAPKSFDALREPKWLYALHVLIGHHGIVSLTPVWLLSWASMARQALTPASRWRGWALWTAATLGISLAYFIVDTNSYGGGVQGFRWLFWMIPLYLVLLVPELERLPQRAWPWAWGALLLSVAAAGHAVYSPWGRSSLHLLFRALGWIDY
jgi:hypothetical protein